VIIGQARDIAKKYGSQLISANIEHGFNTRAKFLFLSIGDIEKINNEVMALFNDHAHVEVAFQSVRVVNTKLGGEEKVK